jgi:hypothetical protein
MSERYRGIMKKYKVMAYILSSGLWDAFGHITLEKVLGFKDEELEADIANWHSTYDDQFKRYPYDFDWKCFNEIGEQLTSRIREKLPPEIDIYYEPSDDREFFTSEECEASLGSGDTRIDELALREKKRTLLHMGISV